MKAPLLALFAATAACVLAQPAGPLPALQPVKILQTVDPIFPDALLGTHRHGGEVTVLAGIREDGQLADWLPTRYTDPLFAQAAVTALQQWKFEPARDRGEPVPVTVELRFLFEVKGVVVSISAAELLEATFNEITGGRAYAPCTLRELDRIPVPLHTVSPAYPAQLASRGAVGEVAVYFYIDERGAVRLPYVRNHDHPLLARLAVEAVRQWRFEPPTRHGRPALVQVRQLFRFSAPVTPPR